MGYLMPVYGTGEERVIPAFSGENNMKETERQNRHRASIPMLLRDNKLGRVRIKDTGKAKD